MSAQSTSQAVGALAVSIVAAVGLPVSQRKTPSFPEGAPATFPVLVISVGEEGKTEYLAFDRKLKTYPVAATIVSNTGQQQADDASIRTLRERLELALEHAPNWSGLSAPRVIAFSEVNLTNKPPFDREALAKDFNYSIVVADVQVVELRG